MYEFIFWMCLLASPECPLWKSVNNIVIVKPVESMQACESMWLESVAIPDPEGMKSRHICQPITESI